ncbi:MAG: hypothetical protein ACYCYN_13185 [Solirubrobacteraceae bacterium]
MRMYKLDARLAKLATGRRLSAAAAGRDNKTRGRVARRGTTLSAFGAALAAAALCCATAAPTVASARESDGGGHASIARRQHHAKAGRSRRGKAALKETYVREEAALHLAQRRGGSAIVEQGAGHGTFNANVQLTVAIKTTYVTGAIVAHLPGGTIYGRAGATPHFSKSGYVSFKGTLKITRGTGRYAHASGTAGFYGAIDRYNFKMSVQVIGRLKL